MAFWRKKHLTPTVDIHSHLIPNIDDGARSVEQSLEMITQLSALGYQKCITTPHIHPKYPNTAEVIKRGLERFQKELVKNEMPMEIEVAAEYFVDESFEQKLDNEAEFLTFGSKLILVECSFINRPFNFDDVMLRLMAKGYKPVLAHPERYAFLEGDIAWLQELKNIGVLFQISLGSLADQYGSKSTHLVQALLKKDMVDFVGSDLHRRAHIPFLKKGLKSKLIQRGLARGQFKNEELI